MKTRQLILTVMVALIACNPVMAQNHIDKIVDELEQKGVDAKKVVKRDPKTKKPYYIVKSLTFYSKDSNYANRLKEAFKKDAEDAIAMLEEENDPEMREMLKEEHAEAKQRQERLEKELKILLLPKDPNDDKDVVVEIRAGAGGDEAALFAAELYRMYAH